jgi:hypothetical protein
MNQATRNLIVIAVVIAVVVGATIFFVAQLGKRGSLIPGLTPAPTPTPIAKTQISEIRLTAEGPIVGNEQYVSLNLAVNATQRTLTTYSTYTNQVLSTQSLANNSEAFSAFLDAELNAGFVKAVRGQASPSPDSTCPQGTRYIYDAVNTDGTKLTSLWTSTCGDGGANFGGDSGQVNQLFKLQFPGIDQVLGHPPLQQLSL